MQNRYDASMDKNPRPIEISQNVVTTDFYQLMTFKQLSQSITNIMSQRVVIFNLLNIHLQITMTKNKVVTNVYQLMIII